MLTLPVCLSPILLILTTPASNPYEVNKSVIQLLMISGRYRDDRLMRYWSPENKQGTCKLCSAGVGDVEHYLKLCQALTSRRQALFDWWLDSSKNDISLTHLLKSKINSISEKFTRFVFHPSADSDFFAAKTEWNCWHRFNFSPNSYILFFYS